VDPQFYQLLEGEEVLLDQIKKVDAPIMELSSTFIREAIHLKKDIRPMVPLKVWEYIDRMNFYQ